MSGPSDIIQIHSVQQTWGTSGANNNTPIHEVIFGPQLPEIFIKVVPHPHSANKDAVIIPLTLSDNPLTSQPPQIPNKLTPEADYRPWTPFQSCADFEYTETAIEGLLSKELVNKQLNRINNQWSIGGSYIMFRNYNDLSDSLEKARKYGIQFKHGAVSAVFAGETYSYDFYYRDPWEYILSLVQDESLASVSTWNSVRKTYCYGGPDYVENRIFDEPNMADTWWDVDSSLPDSQPFPHSFLPLHFWLDKGLVTKHVKAYPMILHAAWLPRKIRNASGNGGGILLGYMPMVNDPGDQDDRKAPERLEFATFKCKVYQNVLKIVFHSLRLPSLVGETHQCNDNVVRILYPGVLIESLDGEEASNFCACRAASALYPCPKCLVKKPQLPCITQSFPLRTLESMRSVIEGASRESSNSAKEKLLQSHGLHDVKHFLWDFGFSDPYAAVSYDTLHSDDLGKWGKHLWPRLKAVLSDSKVLGQLSLNMSQFPYWKDLKHFNHVSTISFSDGQCFYDILKCILPCVVQLLPRNSPFVHCIQAYQKYRLMVGLNCMTEERLLHIKTFIKEYERYCEKVSQVDDKDFKFPKQHHVSHIISDIRKKGTTDNLSTRPGEGFQQEASQAYRQTNKKNIDKQMTRIDENLEAIAAIHMAIDKFDKNIAKQADPDEIVEDAIKETEHHWAFGSRVAGKKLLSEEVEEMFSSTDHDFISFDDRLHSFLHDIIPDQAPLYEDSITVEMF